MVPITPAEFKAMFSEFASVDDQDVQNRIDYTVLWLNGGYGTYWRLILFYLTAHFVVFLNEQKAGGVGSINPTSSIEVDQVSIGSDTNGGDEARQFNDLNGTSYGQQAYNLMQSFKNNFRPFAIL